MYIMNTNCNENCNTYYCVFLVYTIIIIILYKIYLKICSNKKNTREKMIDNLYNNKNSLELIGKFCNINVLKTLRDNCDPRLFNFLKYDNQINNYYTPQMDSYVNPYANPYVNSYMNSNPYIYQQMYDNDYVYHNIGFLYKKNVTTEDKKQDPFYMLPLYAKEYKGGLFEYMTRVHISGNNFEIPIYKNKRLSSLKSREIYDGDEIHIGSPIHNTYIFNQTQK